MLKALECRYDVDEDSKLMTSANSARQAAAAASTGSCPLADSELDGTSSSTSFADSGRGLSCEVEIIFGS